MQIIRKQKRQQPKGCKGTTMGGIRTPYETKVMFELSDKEVKLLVDNCERGFFNINENLTLELNNRVKEKNLIENSHHKTEFNNYDLIVLQINGSRSITNECIDLGDRWDNKYEVTEYGFINSKDIKQIELWNDNPYGLEEEVN